MEYFLKKFSNMIYLVLPMLALLILTSCRKPPHHPKNPNYNIIKPKVIHTPHKKNLDKMVKKLQGSPYVWAEEGPNAFDCSGLTYNIYGQMGMDIPRVAREQAKMGKKIAFRNLHYGDLIFFGSTNKRSKRINHVGIYLGKGWFAHASSKDRIVKFSHFDKEPRYLKRMKLCRRYLSKNERGRYMNCDAPLKKMKISSSRYTTPWKTGMKLPRKAVP